MSTNQKFETPADVRGRLISNWKRLERAILTGDLSFPYTVPVKTPTLKNDNFIKYRSEHRRWVESWARYSREDVSVTRTQKSFMTYKDVKLIKALVFQTQEALALFLGKEFQDSIDIFQDRINTLSHSDKFTALEIFSSRTALSSMSKDSFNALNSLVKWRRKNPNIDISLRELQIKGVDSKWAETNKRVILDTLQDNGLLHSLEGSFYEKTGFRADDMRALWVRVHPSLSSPAFGATEFALRPSTLFSAPKGIKKVLMVENRATYLSFFPSSDTLLLLGDGKMAVSAVRDMPWLSDLDFYYWGDMDSSGFLILDRIRCTHPNVASIFMDKDAMDVNLAMAVKDGGLEGAKVEHLTPAESQTRDFLFRKKKRIEQERIHNPGPTLLHHRLITGDIQKAA